MNEKLSQSFRLAGSLAGALFVLAGVQTRAADKGDAFPNFDSYVKISGQAASITGNDASFQSRTKQPSDGGVGIEDLHISKDLSKATTMVIDGKALAGTEDYLAKLNLAKNEVGSVDVGFKRFRTFYDGAGGFFPVSKQWSALANEDLHVDRAKFWAEATLTLPNAPVLTLRYTNELRSGRKDSTIWGDSDLTGLPFAVAPNPVSAVRKFMPSYINLGERHERIEAVAKQTVGKTTVELTLFGDQTKNLDTRVVNKFPGEVIPWSVLPLSTTVATGQVVSPQNAAKAALPYNNWNNQVLQTQSDGINTKTSGFTANLDTALTDKLTLHFGANYELIHSAVTDDRPLITQTATSTGIVQVYTASNYTGLTGGSRVKDYTGNVSLDYKATKNLTVKVAFRAQDEFVRGDSSFSTIAATVAPGSPTGTPATVTGAPSPRVDLSRIHENSKTPVIDVRYTGIKNLALYATASKRSLDGVEKYQTNYNPATPPNGLTALNDLGEKHGDYKVGANWRQSSYLSLRAELYSKGHKDDSVGFGNRIGDYYLLDSKDTGYRLTAIAKPDATVTLTTRFVSQRTKMQVTGYLPTTPTYDSLSGKNYMIGETVDWTPNSACYVQANINAVYNVIDTIYPRAGVTPAVVATTGASAGLTTAIAWNDNGVLQNSNNNYVSGSVLTGFVVDKATDLQVQANYYKAGNGNAVLAPLTMPYGVAVRDVSLTVGVKHKFSDRWVGNAKLGYFESKNDTMGGFANYHGPVAYMSVDYGL